MTTWGAALRRICPVTGLSSEVETDLKPRRLHPNMGVFGRVGFLVTGGTAACLFLGSLRPRKAFDP